MAACAELGDSRVDMRVSLVFLNPKPLSSSELLYKAVLGLQAFVFYGCARV